MGLKAWEGLYVCLYYSSGTDIFLMAWELLLFIDTVNDILHFVADIIPKKIKYVEYLELVKKRQQAKSND